MRQTLTGCLRFGPFMLAWLIAGAVHAQAPQSTKILISDGTVSQLTEVPANDALLPNSQVYLSGKANFSRFLGVLGIVIDSANNNAKAGAAPPTLALKFVDVVQASVSPSGPEVASFSLPSIVTDGEYDIKLLPSARFNVDDESAASLTFRLTARSKEPGGGSDVTRNYFCSAFGSRPMIGVASWSDDGGAALRDAARRAFAAMTIVLMHDREGRYAEKLIGGNQKPSQFYSKDGRPISAIVLEEMPEFLVWMPVVRDKPVMSVISVVDRRVVRTEKP